MAESKGSQDAKGQQQPTPSGTAGARRTGWSRWRPYSTAIVGVAAVFAVSAVIGSHVRGGETTNVKIPNGMPSTAPQDLAVPVKPAVPVTVTVYEDLRDPQSKAFAEQWKPTFDNLLDSGRAEIAYRLVTTSDTAHGGKGALYAANAAACAQDQGKAQFVSYVNELWKKQPADITDDKFASLPYLEKLGHHVHDMQASLFVPCVQSLDHQGWVRASQADYTKAGLGAVPVIQINGTTVNPLQQHLTPAKLDALVKKALGQVMASASPTPAAS
ncbi:thioredoxin domain-containing protein [Streptomyces sp. SL13]|uniref:Thioredoxin domain-containing protein n=1 Tax=Streptantibioticus silvisoli TaxID=2705255 RepID=A0AA90KHF8_9ACTN|nr:thioredoxin domain-containing protein [Streptantibioticus silvisoli]MDI5964175.1 thioredoxin domain-containing protein [Streptantibioticus silvisoli]MDI5971760.1 thioredoxin domain-containing protein [Streptantibioticus silvisoli]